MPSPEARRGAGGHDLDAVFGALADPVRRGLFERLIAEPRRTPTTLAAGLPITRQAVAKHLAALSAAGLIRGSRDGREVRYEVTAEPLTSAAEWIASVGAEWDDRLARLADLVEQRKTAGPRPGGSSSDT